MLTVFPIRAFRDNYIWVLHNAQDAVLIDPGDAAPCLNYLKAQALRLAAILITHHHSDHTGGITRLAVDHPGRVICPANSEVSGCTEQVADDDDIDIPELGLHFRVIGTPGHTLDHVAYYGANRLFCGDALFGCGCGRVFEGTPEMMFASLQRLAHLPDKTEVFCAHEYTLDNIRFARHVDRTNPALPEREEIELTKISRGDPSVPSTLAIEKATNPFLRCHEPALVEAAERHLKRPASGSAETFAALREMKNHFH